MKKDESEVGTVRRQLITGAAALGAGSAILLASKDAKAHGTISAANVKDFGAIGDGSIDDRPSILAAIASTSHGAVYFPKGTYRITDELPSNGRNLTLLGDGPGSVILVDGGILGPVNGVTFTGVRGPTRTDALNVHGLSFIAKGVMQTAISATWTTATEYSAPHTFSTANIDNVSISPKDNASAFTTGIHLDSAGQSRVSNCMLSQFKWEGGPDTINGYLPNSVGVKVTHANAGPNALVQDIDIERCLFDKAAMGIYVQGRIEGVHVRACTFLNIYGFYADGSVNPGGGSLMNIQDSHFDCNDTCITLYAQTFAFVTNNLLFVGGHQPGHDIARGIHLLQANTVDNPASNTVIAHNRFMTMCDASYTSGVFGIDADGFGPSRLLSKVLIDGNGFEARPTNPWNNHIRLGPHTSDIIVTSSNRTNNAEQVANSGIGNRVWSLPYSPPSWANGKAGETAWDANFLYVCIAPNTWRRVALSAY